ncbi:MAG: glutamate-5-semialdehyde dehydrogenase [Candidatus Omnitrophota bacterium]
MNTAQAVVKMAKAAKAAAQELSGMPSAARNKALLAMAQSLRKNSSYILRANQKDLAQAQKQRLAAALVERLALNEKRIGQMSASLEVIAALADPLGRILRTIERPNGLHIEKVSVPIGVIAIIYESRPNVTADCIGLCLKAGNAVILRGGREAINSNIAIYTLLQKELVNFSLPEHAVGLVKSTERQAVDILLGLSQYIDLVIPRGGESLITHVSEKSKIPVIRHYKGVCHTYVDSDADLAMARKVALNAKVQRPGVCNAMETLLVDKKIAARFLPDMLADLQRRGVEIRGDPATRKFGRGIKLAKESDWFTEYLDLILSVKIVSGLEEAIIHVNHYGSSHSDAIITENRNKAKEFLSRVDSACVYVNASTRFTDGFEFGMGAEMGISTDKLHARGPMALEELTTYKYQITGNGQVRT